jgi:dienelactone hydrolase
MLYGHLGVFSDWVGYARNLELRAPAATVNAGVRARVREALGFFGGEEVPVEARVERRWERGVISGEEVSWSVGYGPRTHAWLLRPAGAGGPLPGVLALHGHGGSKFYGKETIADGPERVPPSVSARRSAHYGDRAFANELAKGGFAVLAHDAFLWGSRRFPLEVMPEPIRRFAETEKNSVSPGEVPEEVALYDAAAHQHEHLIEKYCRLLGTTLAGVVAHEDRVAASYLLSRPGVSKGGVGCVGLSGGGCR